MFQFFTWRIDTCFDFFWGSHALARKRTRADARLDAVLAAHSRELRERSRGERLIEGTLEIEKKIACEELPRPMGLPIFHIRHFPSIVRGAPPSVLELVRLGAENVRYGEDLWVGKGTLNFFPSEIAPAARAPRDPRRLSFQLGVQLPWRGSAASLGLGPSPFKPLIIAIFNGKGLMYFLTQP
jgi:hypothetical protein